MIRRTWSTCSRMKAFLPRETSSSGGHGIFLVRCSLSLSPLNVQLLTRAGNGIINADGDLWRVQRKAGLHFLNNANLKVLTDVALPAYLNETVESLQEVESGLTIDLEEVFHELTTQLMGRMAYDVRKPFPRWPSHQYHAITCS